MKNNLVKGILLCLIFSSSCSLGPHTYYSKEVKDWKNLAPKDSNLTYTVYLIGDAGEPAQYEQEPTFLLLQSQLEKDSNSSVVFLGDNIYHDGLPEPGTPERAEAEKRINAQLDILKNYKGEAYFISGNHDWDYMRRDGLSQIRRQEEYIENYLNRGNTFVPNEGCPGPYYAKLQSNVILLAMDSQWWLHKYEKPYGRCGDCDAEDEQDFLVQMDDYMRNNQNKHILIVAHHPLISNGNHGGYYNVLDHVFPLRLIRDNLYIPLPVLGSLYPLHRKFGGVDQDIPHYRYQRFKNEMLGVITKYDNVLFAAGHDHNLQYHRMEDSLNHIISGSGSKLNPVKMGGDDAVFIDKERGFAAVKYYSNGEAWIEFWVPEGNGDKGKLVFRGLLYERKSGRPESYCSLSAIDYADSTVITKASDKYDGGKFRKLLFGNHYREEWTTPIEVPLLDLKTEKEGLIPYGVGGRKESTTLKLRNIDEKEYVLRSINKDPIKAVPTEFQNTFLHDIVEDQMSAQHPYGALVIPKLAQAVNVFHTNPKIVLIPNDSCLGPYREQFQNMMAIFEEDPDGNHEDATSLGNSKKIVGTDKMRDKIESEQDHVVDEKNFARARLLDMVLGDWDRHDRQYRWATLDTGKGKVYRPVPEDRDQVFFKFDGVIPYFLSRKWSIRNLQNFDEEIDDVIGLTLSGRLIDRRYLQSLTRKDWISIADSMKNELTDQVIESAVHELPDNIFKLHGSEIILKLKSRRDQLTEIAEKYYEVLAKYVDVFSTDQEEQFVVKRLNKNETSVDIYKLNDEGEKETLYSRTFFTSETREIRLYSLGGDDVVHIEGKVKKGIKVRVLGGEGIDSITDNSRVSGPGRKTIVYETTTGNVITGGKEISKQLAIAETVHYPNQDKFFYNYFGPQLSFYSNPDDGAFIGTGAVYKRYKFRGNPYGSQHRLIGSWATNTESARLLYRGDVKNFISKFDLGIDLQYYKPYVMNYFGYGNESVNKDTSIHYYQTRIETFQFNPSFNKQLARFLLVGAGPKYEYYNLENKSGTYLDETKGTADIYAEKQYAGLKTFFRLGTRDNERNPTRGILLDGEAHFNKSLDGKAFYSQWLSSFSFYLSPNFPFQLTIAARIGGAFNTGTYDFYQANTLGSAPTLDNMGSLRGYRKSRFIGDKSFYQNVEVRSELFKFNTYIFPGKFGILGLFDNGKVWVRNEISKKWHIDYGGGLWVDVFHKFILTGTYTLSEEDRILSLRLGFQF